jgi:F-type H+-transporting ATPase subunit delta
MRYAQALFELAREKGALDSVRRDVEFLAEQIKKGEVARALFDGRVSALEKRQRVESLASKLHPLTKNFLQLLIDKRRVEVLRGLGAAFENLVLAEQGAIEGVVESARPLGPTELSQLSQALSKGLGKKVLLETRISRGLLGGARIFAGNRMLDYSVSGRLERLGAKLRAAPLRQP